MRPSLRAEATDDPPDAYDCCDETVMTVPVELLLVLTVALLKSPLIGVSPPASKLLTALRTLLVLFVFPNIFLSFFTSSGEDSPLSELGVLRNCAQLPMRAIERIARKAIDLL